MWPPAVLDSPEGVPRDATATFNLNDVPLERRGEVRILGAVALPAPLSTVRWFLNATSLDCCVPVRASCECASACECSTNESVRLLCGIFCVHTPHLVLAGGACGC